MSGSQKVIKQTPFVDTKIETLISVSLQLKLSSGEIISFALSTRDMVYGFVHIKELLLKCKLLRTVYVMHFNSVVGNVICNFSHALADV